ncbi:MAG: CehA/McbA family metallohydrolase [Candidatus Eisenbacteria bacterium]
MSDSLSADTTYNFYVGNLHSHTSYSDGVGTPSQAFEYARDSAQVHFLAVTDHDGGLTDSEYVDTRLQADVYTENHVFVGIAGQEWTEGRWTHCTILDADHIFTAPRHQYDSLYSEIAISGCTAAFNHPHPDCFDDYAYSSVGDQGINAVEVRNDLEHALYIAILNKGWHVGADGSQDNHQANWGERPHWTVALACSLTRVDILNAARKHRTYSTWDRSLQLVFQAENHWMGESFSHVDNIRFSISVRDSDAGDHTELVELYQNGDRVDWISVDSESCTWCPVITPPDGENSYFVKLTQQDGDRAWSSPIWIDCTTDLPPTPILAFPLDDETLATLTPTLLWHASEDTDTYTLQYSTSDSLPTGSSTVTVTDLTDTSYTMPHYLGDQETYFWRVVSINNYGSSMCSGVGRFLIDVGMFSGDSETCLTIDPADDACPSLAQTYADTWLVWSSMRDGNPELYYKTSSDDGESWSSALRLTNAAGDDLSPAIAEGPNGNTRVAWHSERSGDSEIYSKTYNGLWWSEEINLTQNPGEDLDPSLAWTSDSLTWLVWSSDREDTDFEIYYMIRDGGSWSTETRLTDNCSQDCDPEIMQAESGDLWLVWSTDSDGNFEIYYKTLDGDSWSDDMRLTDSPEDERYPTITRTSDGRIWVAYEKAPNVCYMIRSDGIWSDEAVLHSDQSANERPSVAQVSDGGMWIAFHSDRDGDEDIYAQRSSCGVTGGVDPFDSNNASDPAPSLRSYPNPFSLRTRIEFALRSDCFAELVIVDVLGQEVRSLVRGMKQQGHHTVYWDGRAESGHYLPSGVYFYSLRYGESSTSRKLVILR